MGIKHIYMSYSHSFTRLNTVAYFLSHFFSQSSFFSKSALSLQHASLSLQHAFVESQAAESALQQGAVAAASTVSTSTVSEVTSEFAGLLPQEVNAKENETARAARNNLVFILKNFALNIKLIKVDAAKIRKSAIHTK